MLQRSFRMAEHSVAELQRIAEHLSSIDPARRPPNQTTALAWCIARGIDAVEAAEAKEAKQERDVHGSVAYELRQMQDRLVELVNALSRDRNTRENERRELDRYRRRVPTLESLVARRDAGGRWAEVDEQGHAWTCADEEGFVQKTREIRSVAYAQPSDAASDQQATDGATAPEVLKIMQEQSVRGVIQSLSRERMADKETADKPDSAPTPLGVVAKRLVDALAPAPTNPPDVARAIAALKPVDGQGLRLAPK